MAGKTSQKTAQTGAASSTGHKLPAPTPEQVRWFRMRRTGLVTSFASPHEAAARLVGAQAQFHSAGGLALWNRSPELDHAQLDALLFDDRSLIKLWGQRNTLHIYATADWPLLHAARSVNRTWWERIGERYGVDPETYRSKVEQVAALLRERESLGRSDLRASGIELEDYHYSPWGGIFADLVRFGYACHIARAEGEGRFVHRERWLPNLEWNPPDAEDANVEITRRYFTAYAPGTWKDFLLWRGTANQIGKSWLARLQPEMTQVEVDGVPMWILASDLDDLMQTPPPAEEWPVRMLYRFDPLLLPHKDKSWIVDKENYPRIWRPAGHIEGVVLAQGRAVATWRYDRKSKGVEIRVEPFRRLPRYVRQSVEKIAPRIAAYFVAPLADLTIETPSSSRRGKKQQAAD